MEEVPSFDCVPKGTPFRMTHGRPDARLRRSAQADTQGVHSRWFTASLIGASVLAGCHGAGTTAMPARLSKFNHRKRP
jgi:hypothetical protein